MVQIDNSRISWRNMTVIVLLGYVCNMTIRGWS